MHLPVRGEGRCAWGRGRDLSFLGAGPLSSALSGGRGEGRARAGWPSPPKWGVGLDWGFVFSPRPGMAEGVRKKPLG